MLSLRTDPSREMLEFSPKAIESSFPENQLITMMLWAMSRFSPPHPKIPLPNKAILNDSNQTPKLKTAWPTVTSTEDTKITALTPNLSIKIPPSKGKIILGKE